MAETVLPVQEDAPFCSGAPDRTILLRHQTQAMDLVVQCAIILELALVSLSLDIESVHVHIVQTVSPHDKDPSAQDKKPGSLTSGFSSRIT
jgi:hypothetical protein